MTVGRIWVNGTRTAARTSSAVLAFKTVPCRRAQTRHRLGRRWHEAKQARDWHSKDNLYRQPTHVRTIELGPEPWAEAGAASLAAGKQPLRSTEPIDPV